MEIQCFGKIKCIDVVKPHPNLSHMKGSLWWNVWMLYITGCLLFSYTVIARPTRVPAYTLITMDTLTTPQPPYSQSPVCCLIWCWGHYLTQFYYTFLSDPFWQYITPWSISKIGLTLCPWWLYMDTVKICTSTKRFMSITPSVGTVNLYHRIAALIKRFIYSSQHSHWQWDIMIQDA